MNVCVFCGSSLGDNPIYRKIADEIGTALARAGFPLIYGGGNIGLMGIVADAVLQNKGEVIGVIPDFLLKKEVGHPSLTRLEVVGTMHERKKRMADLADAFVALPGGWGTLDEFAEILTWRQLGLITEPMGILNVDGFFDPLLAQMKRMVEDGFLRRENLAYVNVLHTPEELISWLRQSL